MTDIVVVSANDSVTANENNSHNVAAAELMDISTPSDKDLSALDQVHGLQYSTESHSENVILQNNMTQLQPQQSIVLGTSPVTSQAVTTLTLSQLQSQLEQGSQILTIPANSDSSSRSVIKRQLAATNSSATGPVMTKVIIAKNFPSSQPQAMPIQLNQLQTASLALTSVPSGVSLISQLQPGQQTPTKTVTISSQGIILSPQKQVPSSPSKQIHLTKIPSSPAKTPTKIAMIPVSMNKSPQTFIPVSGTSLLTKTDLSGTLLTNSNQQTVIRTPKKVIIKQEPGMKSTQPITQMLVTNPPNLSSSSAQQTLIPGNVQQIQVPGSKFHYVRLVTTTTQSSTVAQPSMAGTSLVQTRPIAPATATLSSVPLQSAGSQIKVNVPVQGTQMVMAKAPSQVNSQVTTQRILLPAPNQLPVHTSSTSSTLAQIRPAVSNSNVSVPLQTILQASSGNIQGLQGGFALVPATYVPQAQTTSKPQISVVQQPTVIQQQPPQPVQQTVIQPQQTPTLPQQQQQIQQAKQLSEFIPIASKDTNLSAETVSKSNNVNGSPLETSGARPRKPCNCTKSQCLKLYCDCFANGEFCHNCNCMNCANNLSHEEERSRAIKSCLDRNPLAFHPKIGRSHSGKGTMDESRRHNKGCNCKRSGCLKNYCECYEAKIMCSNICKCIGCKNFEESPERKTLMHLADAAEVRVQQQTAAKTKLSSQISSLPSRTVQSASSGERLPYSFITSEVAEATCLCLLAQAEEADRLKMPPVVQERMVIEEFGRCLMQIIESAKQTKASSPPP